MSFPNSWCAAKNDGEAPNWFSSVEDVERLLEQQRGSSGEESSRRTQRLEALVQCIVSNGGMDWCCEDVTSVVDRYRATRLQEVLPELPDFRDTLVTVSFGSRDGGFQLSQEIRNFILGYLSWPASAVYHDYASLVGHPLSTVVTGDDGITRQLNDNWNLYFANALSSSPVMVFVVNEAWCHSPWCALERRQRTEEKAAKQAAGGPTAYEKSEHSDPSQAGSGEQEYQARYEALLELLEDQKATRDRASAQHSAEALWDSIFHAVAFGSGRNEIFIFTEEICDSSEAMRAVHDAVPEHLRFYHTPQMSLLEKGLELHALCLTIVEVIETQAVAEGCGSGVAMHEEMCGKGVIGSVAKADGSKTITIDLQQATAPDPRWGPTLFEGKLVALQSLSLQDDRGREAREREELEGRLAAGRADAMAWGLEFDIGPCPF